MATGKVYQLLPLHVKPSEGSEQEGLGVNGSPPKSVQVHFHIQLAHAYRTYSYCYCPVLQHIYLLLLSCAYRTYTSCYCPILQHIYLLLLSCVYTTYAYCYYHIWPHGHLTRCQKLVSHEGTQEVRGYTPEHEHV